MSKKMDNWRMIMSDWEQSGQTQQEFCRNRELIYNRFTYWRKKSRNKKIFQRVDANIPREDILHDLAEDEKICGCGASLSEVDQEIREELEIIPEQVYVKGHEALSK